MINTQNKEENPLLLQWQSHFAPQNKEDFMLDKMIGFIGAGNMGSAMIGGILDASLVTTSQIIASAHSPETLDKIRTKFSIETTQSNEVVAERSDILFLAVKPNKFSEVLPQIKGHLKPDCIVVSIAAGQPIANIEALLGEVRLVRAMPNTPALVGGAMSALCPNDKVTPEEVKLVESLFNSFGRAEVVPESIHHAFRYNFCTAEAVESLFNSFGRAEVVPESMMDAVVGVSGSSPAYVYMFIEAMADAAVADGMPRAQAYKFAAQSVLGAAKMVLETGKHPGELKDAVCSPGGTTIEAVAALEHGGFRDTVISAQRACSKKSYDMSQK